MQKNVNLRPMRNLSFFSLIFLVLASWSCRSEFEKIRSSNDAELIYKKALEYYEAEEYQKAQTLFELAITGYRGKKEAEEITYKYAYTFYHLQSYILAAYHFSNFAKTFSTSDYREDADFMVAYSNYQLSPSYRLDQSYSDEAVAAFQLYINTYPENDRVEKANNLIDELRKKREIKELENGKLYYDLRQYQAAVHTFENLLKDYPDTENAAYIRYLIVDSAFLLAENSIITKRLERYQEALAYGQEFSRKYPENEFLDEVNQIINKATKVINTLNKDDRYKNQSARAGS